MHTCSCAQQEALLSWLSNGRTIRCSCTQGDQLTAAQVALPLEPCSAHTVRACE